MTSTIALFASSRRNGNTGRLMDRVAHALEIPVIDLAEKEMSPYDYRHCNRHDDFEPLMEQVLAFDRIIFASPVYWYSVSPPMKVFLDRISDYLSVGELLDKGRRLRGKTGYVLCTSIAEEVDSTYLAAYEKTFAYLGMHFGGHVHANCHHGYRQEHYEHDIQAFIRKLKTSRKEPVA